MLYGIILAVWALVWLGGLILWVYLNQVEREQTPLLLESKQYLPDNRHRTIKQEAAAQSYSRPPHPLAIPQNQGAQINRGGYPAGSYAYDSPHMLPEFGSIGSQREPWSPAPRQEITERAEQEPDRLKELATSTTTTLDAVAVPAKEQSSTRATQSSKTLEHQTPYDDLNARTTASLKAIERLSPDELRSRAISTNGWARPESVALSSRTTESLEAISAIPRDMAQSMSITPFAGSPPLSNGSAGNGTGSNGADSRLTWSNAFPYSSQNQSPNWPVSHQPQSQLNDIQTPQARSMQNEMASPSPHKSAEYVWDASRKLMLICFAGAIFCAGVARTVYFAEQVNAGWSPIPWVVLAIGLALVAVVLGFTESKQIEKTAIVLWQPLDKTAQWRRYWQGALTVLLLIAGVLLILSWGFTNFLSIVNVSTSDSSRVEGVDVIPSITWLSALSELFAPNSEANITLTQPRSKPIATPNTDVPLITSIVGTDNAKSQPFLLQVDQTPESAMQTDTESSAVQTHTEVPSNTTNGDLGQLSPAQTTEQQSVSSSDSITGSNEEPSTSNSDAEPAVTIEIQKSVEPLQAEQANATLTAPIYVFVKEQQGVNIRTEPNTDSNIIFALPEGEQIPAVSRTSDSQWIQVRLDSGQLAWVAVWVIELTDLVDKLPVVGEVSTIEAKPIVDDSLPNPTTKPASGLATSPPNRAAPSGYAIELVEPIDGYATQDTIKFVWQTTFVPADNQSYEVVFWDIGDSPLEDGIGLAPLTQDTEVTVHLPSLDRVLGSQFEPGLHGWGILLVQTEPYRRLAHLSGERTFVFREL